MQKYIILLICVFFLSFTFAQTADENFEKAGQAELDKAESQLREIKDRINVQLQQMPKDSVIDGGEMTGLRTLVNEFHQAREEFIQRLLFFEKEPIERLSGWEDKILETYFSEYYLLDLSFKDDQSGTIRKYFIESAGYDITVLDRRRLNGRIPLGLFCGLFVGLIAGKLLKPLDHHNLHVAVGIVLFLIVLVLFILL